MAIVTLKETHEAPSLGPEPPERTGCYAELRITRKGATVFATGLEDLGAYQSIPHALDVAWSPDSTKLAYRKVSQFRVIGVDGKSADCDLVTGNALISSFKWIDDKDLLVVTKGIDEDVNLYGYPTYHGYLAEATDVQVLRLNSASGTVAKRFSHPANSPTFIFHSIGFMIDEISPYSSRIAFSDGPNICVYDDATQKLVAKQPVTGVVEGIWWADDDTLILGLGLLSAPNHRFAKFDIPSENTTDVTDDLLPKWDGMYNNDRWFR